MATMTCMGLLSLPSWAFRCGNHLITEGNTEAQVQAYCGAPTEVHHHSVLRPAVIWRYGRPWRIGNGPIAVDAQTWIYNLGPYRFMRRLRLEDGIVVAVDTLGYGYNASAGRPVDLDR